MKDFDITRTYTTGDQVLHDYKVFEYQPDKEWYPEFSTGFIPSSWGWGVNGWKALNTWSMVKPSHERHEYKKYKKNINCLSGNYEGVLHYSNIKTAIQRLFNKVVSIFTGVRQKKSD